MSDENSYMMPSEQLYHIKLDEILKLKNSTQKLLYLLEEIQSKTYGENLNPVNSCKFKADLKPALPFQASPITASRELEVSENKANTLDAVNVEDEKDDCSVHKRLTRKCYCLNRPEYNDFIIQFNEDTKYFKSTLGEIIKNMYILKKLLYVGGAYTKNALLFLNEGLSNTPYSEKMEIIQACMYADVCNIFDDHSIVTVCISWPCKQEYYGDTVTQALAAGLLYKLAQTENGRRYLNLSSKITIDIKKVLKKKASKLQYDTLESLNGTINLLQPPQIQKPNMSQYCKAIDEGVGSKTIDLLTYYRKYMTLDEVFTHLKLLNNLSTSETGRTQFKMYLPALLKLFKHMLVQYDNSEMNIIITNLLTNLVSKNMVNGVNSDAPKTITIADAATEPIQMNESNQVPIKNTKKLKKSKLTLGSVTNKHRQQSKRKKLRSSIIVVPIEKLF